MPANRLYLIGSAPFENFAGFLEKLPLAVIAVRKKKWYENKTNLHFHNLVLRLIDNGKLKGYRTFFESANNYDKAIYKWVNDSTLTFKLIDSSSNLTESYTVTGYKSTTGLTKNK